MQRGYEVKSNIKTFTNAYVFAAIRYLDPGLIPEMNAVDDKKEKQDVVFATCGALIVLLFGFVAFIWLYRHAVN